MTEYLCTVMCSQMYWQKATNEKKIQKYAKVMNAVQTKA